MIKISYYWRPVLDYSNAPHTLAEHDLPSLFEVWADQRGALEGTEGLIAFNGRLVREWSVGIGFFERIHAMDRGVNRILVERGLDSSPIRHQGTGYDSERVTAVLRDHGSTVDDLLAFARDGGTLTSSYIRQLHARLTHNQDLYPADSRRPASSAAAEPEWRGVYKTKSNNPTRPDGSVHQYCPPELVATVVERLIELHNGHVDAPPEVEAAWLHHRFTQIHPFDDGNGRVARCLASLVFLRAGWFPLVIRDTWQERERYLDAVEAADLGDLVPLIALFAAAQRRTAVQALGVQGRVLDPRRAEEVVDASRDLLAERGRLRQARWRNSKDTAHDLLSMAYRRLERIADLLRDETAAHLADSHFSVDSEEDGSERGQYFRGQVHRVAKGLGYTANTSEHRCWARLVLWTGTHAEIVVSLHATGPEFRGVVAASALYFQRDETGAGERELGEALSLSSDIFQINYREPPSDAAERFGVWLEEILVEGLETWRAGL